MGFLIELSVMNPRATIKPAPTSPMEQQSYWGVAQAGVGPRGALNKVTPISALYYSMYFGSQSKCKAV